MRRFLFTVAVVGLAATPVLAGDGKICTKTDGSSESNWIVQSPAGSSDYFNVRFDVADCDKDGDGDAGICGQHQKTFDFSVGTPFPLIGTFLPNLGLDPSGNTPDLGALVAGSANDPGALHGGVGQSWCFNFPTVKFSALGGTVHAVACFPPGDPAGVGVSADSDTGAKGGDECPGQPNPFDSSGFTLDGYSTPAIAFGSGDFHLNLLIDPSCEQLPLLYLNADPGCGDFCVVTTGLGCNFGLCVVAPAWPGALTLWALFISFLGAPIIKVGPVLPAFPVDKDGDGVADYAQIAVGSQWPPNAGNLTINFVIISGCPGVLGSIGISNEVTVKSLPDPPPVPWGSWDDGTIESGWVVQFPSMTCDYHAQLFDDCPGISSLSSMDMSVLDFGTTASAYPHSGFAPPNTGLDPSRLTPDLGNPYVDQPFSFPSLTFCTTSGLYINHNYGATATAGDVVGFVSFPPGDSGFLGLGADSSSTPRGKSTWTLNCYTTPGNPFFVNWGMRVNP
jgi:hypothetical protein